jgi:predicted small lipoprotein YifL
MNRAALGMGSLRVVAVTLAVSAYALLAGCGQKGALYLPEAGGEVITRPMQTPEAPATPEPPPATQPSPSETKKPAIVPATPPSAP